MESKTYWKDVTFPERIDYVGYQNNELVYVVAVEQLLELETPTKAKWMRMLLCELNRIHSHLVFLGTSALELGAISMFWYCFPRAGDDPRSVRARDGAPDAHALFPGRRARRGHPAGLLSRGAQVRRVDAQGRRRMQRLLPATRSGSSGRRASACCRLPTRSHSASPGPSSAPRASTGICASASRTSLTTRSISRCRSSPRAMCTPATASRWTRWASRTRSSASASTGSSTWRKCRGSRTTARSFCRRARSSRRRWSR